MTDRDILIWIHERLVHEHGESPYRDYMHRLRAVIKGLPRDKASPHVGSNDMPQFQRELALHDALAAEGWFRRLLRRLGEHWTEPPSQGPT